VSIAWEAEGISDVGRVRQGNEDAFLLDARRGVFLVADGMGGHAAGEVASALAAETAADALARAVDEGAAAEALPAVMTEAFHRAQERIALASDEDPRTRGMGTTLTACVLTPRGECVVGHVGDSRAYLLSGDSFEQLTVDHTWVQRELAAGRLRAEAVRRHPLAHILTRVLIAEVRESPDILTLRVYPGDLLLLASDGLTGMLEDVELARLLRLPAPLSELARALVDHANAHGGVDNVTAVIVRVLPGVLPEAPPIENVG
jgi:PPM family protein phosphatase